MLRIRLDPLMRNSIALRKFSLAERQKIAMGWKVVDRRIGRAGGIKQRETRQREWDSIYGEGMWTIGYLIDGDFISQEDALETIYYQSYEDHFKQHPADLEELIHTAKFLRNPHA